MRLTLKLLVRLFFLVMVILFALPLLLNYLDSQEQARATKELERRRKAGVKPNHEEHNLDFHHDPLQPPKPGDDQLAPAAPHNGVEHQQQRPQLGKPAGHDKTSTTTKKYGPKAYLRPGQPGNYEPVIHPRSGPGEDGQPVYTTMEERGQVDRSVQEYGFNMVASNKISMTRTIPDTRMDECKYWHYPEKLPTASVIIVFHNEGWSTLLRTVHSVINMSPPELLHEIVMVDDFSEKEDLKDKLAIYLKNENFKGKIKLYRNPERYGLILTRTKGAEYATGDVIVFLDAHCECNKNWLPPLLARIAYDRSIMVVPVVDAIRWKTFQYYPLSQNILFRGIFDWGLRFIEAKVPAKVLHARNHTTSPYWTIMAVPTIDGIDWNTFRYSPVYIGQEHFRGIFEWGFLYKESRVPEKELKTRKHSSESYRSPTHAGGLFAMDRKYFFELGAYDPGLQIWGGENFELSFKIWQCGGSIEWVPCSRVGHVYRNAMPYGFGKINPKIPVILLNYMRVVEVWLDDEYKEYFYTREPTIRGYPIGDITKQLKFKKDFKCKSFKWFMENVAFEVTERFPHPPPNKAWGEIKMKSGYLCWDTRGQHVGGGPIGLSACHHYGGNQLFRLNVQGQLASGEWCLHGNSAQITVSFCQIQPTGPWKYNEATGAIYNQDRQQCVEADAADYKLEFQACNPSKTTQQWEIKQVRTW